VRETPRSLTRILRRQLQERGNLRDSSAMKRTYLHTLTGLAALWALAVALPAIALPDIYPPPEQAQAELTAALKEAAAQHRRVIVDFGGNWCTDCHVLDSYMHDSTNQPLIDANFLVVHVNVGRTDQNLNIAERYGIPLKKGVPAIAVLSSRGKLLHSQTGGEFEDMRHMDSSALTEFLQRWKPAAHRPRLHAAA
jgi:thiol:disulfide interchange protein